VVPTASKRAVEFVSDFSPVGGKLSTPKGRISSRGQAKVKTGIVSSLLCHKILAPITFFERSPGFQSLESSWKMEINAKTGSGAFSRAKREGITQPLNRTFRFEGATISTAKLALKSDGGREKKSDRRMCVRVHARADRAESALVVVVRIVSLRTMAKEVQKGRGEERKLYCTLARPRTNGVIARRHAPSGRGEGIGRRRRQRVRALSHDEEGVLEERASAV